LTDYVIDLANKKREGLVQVVAIPPGSKDLFCDVCIESIKKNGKTPCKNKWNMKKRDEYILKEMSRLG
jgi:hypothetical protein